MWVLVFVSALRADSELPIWKRDSVIAQHITNDCGMAKSAKEKQMDLHFLMVGGR